MPTPLEIARSENRNFLLFSDEDLIDKLYDQYQDRYPNKQLFTEFLTTDVGQFDTSKLTPVSPNIPQTETETEVKPEPEAPTALGTLKDFGTDLITKAIPAGFLQATGSGLKYGAALEKLPDYLSGDTNETTEQYKAAKRVLANQDNFELSLVERAKEIVDLYENEYSARNSEFFKAGEELQEFSQKKFPQDERWKDNALADTIYKGFEGIGSTVPIIGASVVTAPLGGPVPLLAGLSTAIAMEGGESVDRVYDFDGERTEEDVMLAALLGVAPGSVDYLPVGILLNRFNKVIPGSKSRIINGIKNAIAQGVWEGGTEETQNVIQNLIEQTYNNERAAFDYAGEQFGPGFVAGLVFGGISSVGNRRDKNKENVKEKTVIENDPEEGTTTVVQEGQTENVKNEAANVGTADEVAPDSSPDGYPPVGSENVVIEKAGARIGTGRVLEYPPVILPDGSTSKNIRVQLVDGSIVEEPVNDPDLNITWNDKNKAVNVEEEVDPTIPSTVDAQPKVEEKPETEVVDKTDKSALDIQKEITDLTLQKTSLNNPFLSEEQKEINEPKIEELDTQIDSLENQLKAIDEDVAVDEIKPKTNIKSITGDNGWNRQMGSAIASDNQALKDELTQTPLEDLLENETNISVLKVTENYLRQGKVDNETVQNNFDLVNKKIAELERTTKVPDVRPTPVEQPIATVPEVETPTPVTPEPARPTTTAEEIFAEPTTPTAPVEETATTPERVFTDQEVADILTAETPTPETVQEIVDDSITEREQAVQKREDDLKFNQGVFKLYDPRSAITNTKEYNSALNAYRREIADPQVAGRKYLEDVESAYAQRVNELTDTNRLDNLVDPTDTTNNQEFKTLLKEIGNATLDVKEDGIYTDKTSGKIIRKKTAEIKTKPVKDAIKHIKDKKYDTVTPVSPPLPETQEPVQEEIRARDDRETTRDVEPTEQQGVLRDRERARDDTRRVPDRDPSDVQRVPQPTREPSPVDVRGRTEPTAEARDTPTTRGQDIQSQRESGRRIIGTNVSRDVSGQLGDTINSSESGVIPDPTTTEQGARRDFQGANDTALDQRQLSNAIGEIGGLSGQEQKLIKDIFTFDQDMFTEVYLNTTAGNIDYFDKTDIPNYLKDDIETRLIDTQEDQENLLEEIYDKTKNKYPELTQFTNRHYDNSIKQIGDEFADMLDELETDVNEDKSLSAATPVTPKEETTKAGGSRVFGVPTYSPTAESYAKIKPKYEKFYKALTDKGLDHLTALKQIAAKIDQQYVDPNLSNVEKNKIREESAQWKTSMGSYIRFATEAFNLAENQTQGNRQSNLQVKYRPSVKSASMDTHMPIQLMGSTKKGLRQLEIRVGDLKSFVAQKLEMTDQEIDASFGAEQVEALALSIDQLEQNKGFVIGDQTGIGKGRVVAALLRYAKKNAKHAVFVTQKKNLYTDMIRDLQDIGENIKELKILATNNENKIVLSSIGEKDITTPKKSIHEANLEKLAEDQTALENDYDYVFTTYDQMIRQSTKPDKLGFTEIISAPRHKFLESIAPNAIFILDESHTAGGMSTRKAGEDLDTRAEFVRDLLRQSRGAIYSSATWAKNPAVMDLYMNTDIQLAVPDADAFVDVMQKRGLPLQQIITSMLTETGQYRRVERSFDGVEYNIFNDGNGVIHDTNVSKSVSDILIDIHNLDFRLAKVRKDVGSQDSVANQIAQQVGKPPNIIITSFKSQLYNVSSNLMTSFKVQDTLNLAVNEVKNNNRKIVIALSRTNESFISKQMDIQKKKSGDILNITYADLLKGYLERTREYSVSVKLKGAKKPIAGTGEKKKVTDQEIVNFGSQEFLDGYNELMQRIDADPLLKDIIVNPIDAIINGLKAQGIRVGEVTGRNYTLDSNNTIQTLNNSPIQKRNRIDEFQDGKLDVLIINESGATGFSMHADQKAKDQRQRHMIIMEPHPNVTTYMQMLGRVFRTGQVVKPVYTSMNTDHPAESRLSSVLAKKMASLNALVTGGQQSKFTTADSIDFFNATGDRVVKEFLEGNAVVRDSLGIDVSQDRLDGVANEVSKNLLLFDIDTANTFYDFVIRRYNELKQEEIALGKNTFDVVNYDKAKAKNLGDSEKIQEGDMEGSPFEQPVFVEEVLINKLSKPFTLPKLQEEIKKSVGQGDAKQIQETINNKQQEFVNLQTEIFDQALVDAETRLEEDKLQAEKDRINAVRMSFAQFDRFKIGDSVRIRLGKDEDSTVAHGIILDKEHVGGKSASNLGSFKIKIALADGDAQVMTLSYARFIKNNGAIDKNNSLVVSTTTDRGTKILDMFKEGNLELQEKRFIVTGNLVTGASLLQGGSFAKLQRDNGEIQQVIIMPKNFKMDKARSNIPERFKNADEVFQFFVIAPSQAEVKTFKGDILLKKIGGDVTFILDKNLLQVISQNPDYKDFMPNFKPFGKDKVLGKLPIQDGEGFNPAKYAISSIMDQNFSFETTDQDIAVQAKEDVAEQNRKDPNNTRDSVGAFRTPPEEVFKSIKRDEQNIDKTRKRQRNTITQLLSVLKKRKNPKINKTQEPHISTNQEALDNITLSPKVKNDISNDTLPSASLKILKHILPTYTLAKRAFRDSGIINLVEKAIDYQTKIRVRSKTFLDRYKKIRKKYKDANFGKVTDLLFVGDGAQRTFTNEELKQGFKLTPKEVQELKDQGFSQSEINKVSNVTFTDSEINMYQEFRKLFDTIGRYIDNHRRFMLSNTRSAQALIRNRLQALVAPDSLTDLKRLMVQRSNLMRRVRTGVGNPQTNLFELNKIDSQIISLQLADKTVGTKNKFLKAFEQFYQEENKLQDSSVRRRVGYIPHKFFGAFKLKIYAGLDENGQEVYENLITPGLTPEVIEGLRAQGRTEKEIEEIQSAQESSKNTLFYRSKEDAIQGAQEYVKANPDAEIVIEPVNDMRVYANDPTVLNDQEYRSVMNGVVNGLSEKYTAEELVGTVQQVIRRKGRRVIPEFSLKRRGVAGYDKNLDKVFRVFSGSVAKYVYMDELKYDYINLMEKKGWGEPSEVSSEARPIADWMQQYWDDLNNKPQKAESTVDNFLNQMEKSFGSNKKIYYAAGIGAISAGLAGVYTVPLILGGTAGILLGRTVGRTSRKSRAVTGDMLSLSAHFKLGAFFNLSSAIVNLSQIGLNTYSKEGAVNTAAGMRRALSALYRLARNDYENIIKNRKDFSEAKVKAAMDAKLLADKVEVKSSYFYSDRAPDIFEEQSKLGQISMMWFQSAETINRATSFFAGMTKAEKQGKNLAQQIKQGQFSVRQQQFSYDNAAKPEVLRNVFLRVPLQFKNWLIQEIVFITGLRGAEIPRFMAATFMLAGALGHPAYALINAVIKGLFDYDSEEELTKWAINESAKGDLNGMVGQFITRGFPAVVHPDGGGFGVDLVNRVGFGDRFLPNEIRDFYGPFASTILQFDALKQEGASTVDHLVNLSPAFKVLKSVEATAGGMPLSTIFSDPEVFTNAMTETLNGNQKPKYVNPYRNSSLDYEVNMSDIFRMTFGFMPTKISQLRDISENVRKQKENRNNSLELFRTDINLAVTKFGTDLPRLRIELTKIIEEAIADGLDINKDGVRRMIRDAFLGKVDKELKTSSKNTRPEIVEQIQALEEFYNIDVSKFVGN